MIKKTKLLLIITLVIHGSASHIFSSQQTIKNSLNNSTNTDCFHCLSNEAIIALQSITCQTGSTAATGIIAASYFGAPLAITLSALVPTSILCFLGSLFFTKEMKKRVVGDYNDPLNDDDGYISD